MVSKCLAFDYGLRYTGVAVAYVLTQTVQPLDILQMQKGEPDWMVLEELFREWEPDIFLVGYPLGRDGKEQKITVKASAFARSLTKKFAIAHELVDERYSTKTAKSDIFELHGYKGLKNKRLDSHSAVIICQQWMQSME